ncbi:TrkH family potassium uptake protein [Corynebacterium uterequi]|uniref:Trk-type K+ transport system, membrane component n=1 Tax=Corynebacterium uterequi TaxID=1072256 RepID=A0A0G3HA05_9CORY|nr:potassium transporter TrkG [Corynebacterium uterequi]AKK10129.1 Trk-type K+ transport system, membrane component [Corynebacterium uterequi]
MLSQHRPGASAQRRVSWAHRADARTLTPSRMAATGIVGLVAGGTALLACPLASADGHPTDVVTALFTAVSAVSLTGLAIVDTGSHFSTFGEAVIITLIQTSGLGVMTLATLLGIALSRRLQISQRRVAEAEGRMLAPGRFRTTVLAAVILTLTCEATAAVVMAVRFAVAYDMSAGEAVWQGLFHAISAFNNAGFSLSPNNLISYHSDGWILLPIAASVIIGGLGYPVLADITRKVLRRGSRPWSMTTSITVQMTLLLLAVGTVGFAISEFHWTFADLGPGAFALNSFFAAVTPRTAGFNAIDYGEASPATLLLTDVLMFFGGGSAGTAGGLKVTTLAVVLAAVSAEFAGRRDTCVGRRIVPAAAVRQALAVLTSGLVLLVVSIIVLRLLEPSMNADAVTFEVISAFGTVGLSAGITADLSVPSLLMLCVVMLVGRLGPFTLVAALALRRSDRHFSYPEERPYIG